MNRAPGTEPPATFHALRQAVPVAQRSGNGTTTGRGSWPGAPRYSITLAAAAVLAPTLADLDTFIDRCTPNTQHICIFNQLLAHALTRTIQPFVKDPEVLSQLIQLEEYTPAPVLERLVLPPPLPTDITRQPASPVISAIANCAKRGRAVRATVPERRAGLRDLAVQQYSMMLTMTRLGRLEGFTPEDVMRGTFAWNSAITSGPDVQDFERLPADQLLDLLDQPFEALQPRDPETPPPPAP